MEPIPLRKLLTAFGSYGVLSFLAFVTLDYPLKQIIWIFMGYLAVRTWIHYRRSHLP